VDCGRPLSLGRRLLGKHRCRDCEAAHDARVREELARKEAEHDRALRDYAAVAGALRLGVDLDVALDRIDAAARSSALPSDELAHVNETALSVYVDEALADDIITPEENALIAHAAERLGVRLGPAQWAKYSVAASNAGILPRVAQPRILLNADEADLIEAQVALLTERVITERRTTYNSISVPIGSSGIRYRTGQARGRTVVVGTRTEVADRGVLAVTSDRVVFAGASQVMEFPHHRLVGVRVFGDGLGLQIANRKSVPTFRTGAPMNDILAAVLGTAVAMSRGTFVPPVVAPVRRRATPLPPLPLGATAGAAAAAGPPSAPPAGTEQTTGAAPDPALRMLLELARFPGRPPETAALEAAHSVGAVTAGQLEQALRHLHEAAVAEGLPPALTPYPPGERPASAAAPFVRSPTPELEAALARLRALGLTVWQSADLRDDWRRGLATDAQLNAVARVLGERSDEPSDLGAEPPYVPAGAEDETAPGAFYLLNTNAGNDVRDDADMLAHAKAAAFFDPWKYQIERLAKGDVVFLYRTGEGIVAFGRASGRLETRAYHGDPANADEEYAMALDGFTVLDTPMPAAEIKQVAERNVSFRQTMIALPGDAGGRILAAARARAA
jgi:hypothetical protein